MLVWETGQRGFEPLTLSTKGVVPAVPAARLRGFTLKDNKKDPGRPGPDPYNSNIAPFHISLCIMFSL